MVLALLAVLLSSAWCGLRRWLVWASSTCSRRNSPKRDSLILAKLLGDVRRASPSMQDLFLAVALTAGPLLLIANEPDLGTAVTLLPVLGVIVFAAGLPVRYLGIAAVVAVVSAPVAWMFALQDYQKERIVTFLAPEQDARSRRRASR
jgi:rod shape determining protein RodA